MDELNRSQLILLTLLVSFVTSIATGIVTVTLLEQAPPAVTQTINRVVEKTVERVVPGETKVVETVREVETVKTEDDLVVSAVQSVSPAVVELLAPVTEASGEKTSIVNRKQTGFLVSTQGYIATIASTLTEDGRYQVSWKDQPDRLAEVVFLDRANNLALLQIEPLNKDKPAKESFPSVTFSTKNPALGQTVLALGGQSSFGSQVSTGIISGLREETASTSPRLQTTVNVTVENNGGPLTNLRGEVIGILIGSEGEVGKGLAAPARLIRSALDRLLKKTDAPTSAGDPAKANAAAAAGFDNTKNNQ